MGRSGSSWLLSKPVAACLTLNLCVWITALVSLSGHAVYYPQHFQTWEGPYPQVAFGWGLPLGVDPMSYTGLKIAFFANIISWVPVNAMFHLVLHNQQAATRIFNTTVYGYQMIVWVLSSFVQWYLIGWGIQRVWHIRSGRQGAAPNQSASTTMTR